MKEILSNISIICSIIGLPLALWQIYGLKSRIESTERGIRSILDIRDHEELNSIYQVLVEQHQELSNLIIQVNNIKKHNEDIIKKCENINKEMNNCIFIISLDYKDIMANLKQTIEYIEEFMESDMQNNTTLKEARDYLNNALQKLKQKKKEFEDKEIMLACNNNK